MPTAINFVNKNKTNLYQHEKDQVQIHSSIETSSIRGPHSGEGQTKQSVQNL